MKMFSLVLIMLFCFTGVANAEFKIEFPMETNLTGFWFPSNNAFAIGVSHTVLRLSHTQIPKVTLDFDGTLAKEINIEKDNLGGVGIKINYNIQKATETGFVFTPSLGITALSNIKSFATILQDYHIAIYGTLILYKW